MGREGAPVLVNGQIEPTVTVTPGGYERWRIINACTARFLRLRADGAELLQTAGDAGPLAEPASVSEVTLATGNRAELLVGIAEAGRHRLVAEPVDRGTPYICTSGRCRSSPATVGQAMAARSGCTSSTCRRRVRSPCWCDSATSQGAPATLPHP